MSFFEYGEYVTYIVPGAHPVTGRFVKDGFHDTCFLLFEGSCRMNVVSLDHVYRTNQKEAAAADKKLKADKIGYHVFDAECPDFDWQKCNARCPKKDPRR